MDRINFAHSVWVNNKTDDKFRIEQISVVKRQQNLMLRQ